MLNFASLLQPLDGVSSESENERLPNGVLDCKTRGAYAPGFGLIPPRLGLWARPLDGFDFSISTERGLSLFEVVLHHLPRWKKLWRAKLAHGAPLRTIS